MQSTLYIIGVGPGDPNLLTLKSAKILEKCQVIISPKGSTRGNSTALSIVNKAIDITGKEVHELLFPMKKIHIHSTVDRSVQKAWLDAAHMVLAELEQGNDVAFPTLGDPAIYSTGYYLYETIMSISPNCHVQFVPGIPSMSSCSAATSTPICLGDEMLAVIPATFSDRRIRQTLENFDTIVLMKVHRVVDQMVSLLRELNLLERSMLIERAGMENERVIHDLSTLPSKIHYFSTLIVRKNGSTEQKFLEHELQEV